MDLRYLSELGPTEIRTHVEQTHSLWGDGLTLDDRHGKLVRRMVEAGPARFSMAGLVDDRGQLVASLKRYTYSLGIRGTQLPAVGLGAIFTPTEQRRQGLAARLIERVLAGAESELGCRAAFLYSDIDPAYYRKFGFTELRAERFTWATSALPAGPGLRAEPARNPALLREFYRTTVAPFPLSTVRDEIAWRLFQDINSCEQTLALFTEENPDPVGWLAVSPQRAKNYLWVQEWCADAGQETAIWATIRRLAEAAGLAEARGWGLPHYRALPVGALRPRTDAVPMLRLAGGRPVLEEEASYAWFSSADHY